MTTRTDATHTSLALLLFKAIYPLDPDMCVPYVYIVTTAIMLLATLLLAAWLRNVARLKPKRRKHMAHAWALLDSPRAAHPALMRGQNHIVGFATALVSSSLLLLCLPIKWKWEIASFIYVAHGALDTAVLVWSSRTIALTCGAAGAATCASNAATSIATTTNAAAATPRPRAAADTADAKGASSWWARGWHNVVRPWALVGVVTVVRLACVANQPRLQACNFLYPFAPTRFSMVANFAHGILALTVLAATLIARAVARDRFVEARRGRVPPAAATSAASALSAACVDWLAIVPRGWLFFIALCYLSSSLGYCILLPRGVDDTAIVCAQWVGYFLYACLFAPALQYELARAQRALRLDDRSPGTRPLLANAEPPVASVGGAFRPVATTASRLSTVGHGVALLPDSIRKIPDSDLRYHRLVGTGGFAEVYKATWRRPLSATEGDGATDSASPRGSASFSAQPPPLPPVAAQQPPPRFTELTVAVKRLHTAPDGDGRLLDFCREIGLLDQLQHRNVLALLGITVGANGGLGVVTEYLPRGSVFQLLQRHAGQPPALSLAWRLLRGCARGMAYLHSLSPPIIHRDLKSQNLLVGADYTVKVGDFGLARECLRTQNMTRVGSVQWAAVEVLLGTTYSHKCDLWSFGVVCWELMTAKVPFHGLSAVVVATKVGLEGMRLPVPPDAPRLLLRLMARCWSEDPGRRPEFAEVLDELEDITALTGAAAPDSNAAAAGPSSRAGSTARGDPYAPGHLTVTLADVCS